MIQQILFLVAVFSLCFAAQLKEVTEENCEVCVKIINKFTATLDEKTRRDYQKVENAFKKFCKTANHDDNRFCYYVGGLEESATTMLGELSKPISFFMPAEKICLKLYRRDAQICDLKYEKSFDLTKVNFDKLKVADLKNILSNWGEVCRGCSEKSEYIALVKELLPKYAPEVASAREL